MVSEDSAARPGETPHNGAGAAPAKVALRRALRARRGALDQAWCSAASRAICSHLERWLLAEYLPAHPGAVVGVYLALPGEASLDALLPKLLLHGVTLAAPRLEAGPDDFALWRLDGLEGLETGPYGVRQPPATVRVAAPNVVLVPGLAFDGNGGRLGMGGGWYDRVLPGAGLAIGVCFEWQRVALVPREAHDVRVAGLVTEAGGPEFVTSIG